MPIAEPPPTYNLWPEVRAVTGWPTSDEDQARVLAAGWRTGGESFTRAGGHDVTGLAEGWQDGAGQAMQRNVGTMLQRAAQVGVGMAAVAGRADAFAGEVAGVKQGINDLMAANIELYGREIATLPAAAQPAAHAGFVQQLAGMVTEMMTTAAGRITAAGPIEGIDPVAGSARFAGAAGAVVPPEFAPGTDPAVVRQVWDSLSDPERAAILANDPDSIRGLDGIPAAVRDEANEAALRRELAALRGSEQELIGRANQQVEQNGVDPAVVDELNEVRRTIGALEAIDRRVTDDQSLFLLGYDTAGDGRAIIASGNPDTARNVITHVPGGFHDLTTVTGEGGLDRAISLREAAGGGEPAGDTSSIFWLGYDSPGTEDEGLSDRQAAEGKAALQQFQLGLRAGNDDARLTVEGHSYGTTVIGHAAREQLAADHLILVASVDPGVQRAADYHLDRVDPADIGRHVHATQAINDHLATALTDRFGNNPTLPPIGNRPGFGADVFETSYTLPDVAHNASYADGNAALETIRDITQGTGNYGY